MKGKTLLKVTGILMIIGSVIMILTGALGIVGAVEASKYYETAALVGMAETLYILTAAYLLTRWNFRAYYRHSWCCELCEARKSKDLLDFRHYCYRY